MHSPATSVVRRLSATLGVLLATALQPAGAQQVLTPPMPDLTGILNSSTTEGKTGLQWAIVLGKALFWDQQAGSDGVACASCHFHAGADSRLKNQLSPGVNDVTRGPGGDTQFGSNRSDTGSIVAGNLSSGALAGPNYTLNEADFPLHKLSLETDRNSDIVTSTNDVVASQGAFAASFTSVNADTGSEACGTAISDVFHVDSLASRQATTRHSAPTINAIFNRRTLWDGAANNMFNGVGGFGMRDINGDKNKRLIVLNSSNKATLGYLQLTDASLASQAVKPPVNALEMSCAGRTLADVGRKLMATSVRPLMTQRIDAGDSVFAGLIDPSGIGLPTTLNYATLVKRAFDAKYWNTTARYSVSNGKLSIATNGTGYTQIEHNWSMFWGLAIMLYESTLISNTSEFDGLLSSGLLTIRDIRTGAPFGCTANGTVDELLLRGCKIFFQSRDATTTPPGGGCQTCHGGKDLFTNASRQTGQRSAPLVELGTVLDGQGDIPGFSDTGFTNVAARPVFTDLKLGGNDPYSNPLSYARQYSNFQKARAANLPSNEAMAFILDPDLKAAIQSSTVFLRAADAATADAKIHIFGATKSPSMRNVALTPPYTSTGMFSNLRQVLKFYNRATNRRNISAAGDADAMGTACTDGDNSGTGVDGIRSFEDLRTTPQSCDTNLQVAVGLLGLLDCELSNTGCSPDTDDLAALTRFLKSLTDPRVQCDKAPFDHPSLGLTVGHASTDGNGDGKADDIVFELPAVGALGYDPVSGLCIPNAGNLFAPGMQARVGGALAPP